jgi:hypothetical protein
MLACRKRQPLKRGHDEYPSDVPKANCSNGQSDRDLSAYPERLTAAFSGGATMTRPKLMARPISHTWPKHLRRPLQRIVRYRF